MNVWRLRMKQGRDREYSAKAWGRDVAGVWYGAWTKGELDLARASSGAVGDAGVAERLNQLPAQRDLGWHRPISASDIKSVMRFCNIAPEDWVVLYFDGQLGLAQLDAEVSTAKQGDELNGDEILKYRRLASKKQFAVRDLPDVYRLIASQGRSNVHKLGGMRTQIEFLAGCASSSEVRKLLREKTTEERLNFLSAAEWESFCLAYLILEEGYLPTGLACGGTLPVVDIVGRREEDGKLLVAQCKKSKDPVSVPDEFLEASRPGDVKYYFAYGGCTRPPAGVEIFTGEDARTWLETSNGARYWDLLWRI